VGGAFLITLREGLEMALIVAIVLAYVKKMGRERDVRLVWAGTLAAAAISVAAGAVIFAAVGELRGRPEEIVEGAVAFVAAGVLTWMVFWMRRQARTIKSELHHRVDQALASGSSIALAGIAFFAIVREGLETALFLLGSAVGGQSSLARAVGGFAGIAAAAIVGVLLYRGSRRVNVRSFFTVTGVLVLLFAAGLLAKGIHEFQEAGLFGTFREHLWDVSWVSALNPESSRFAEFLKGLLGWNPAPSVEMVVAYAAYVLPVGATFLAGARGVPGATPASPVEPAAVRP
jgi:high-affinity iron transporter